jgi:carbon-monoxide dehydrogenase medium subunit
VPDAEAVLAGGAVAAEVGAAAAEAIDVRDEPGVSAHYRRGLVRTLVARACEEAAVR